MHQTFVIDFSTCFAENLCPLKYIFFIDFHRWISFETGKSSFSWTVAKSEYSFNRNRISKKRGGHNSYPNDLSHSTTHHVSFNSHNTVQTILNILRIIRYYYSNMQINGFDSFTVCIYYFCFFIHTFALLHLLSLFLDVPFFELLFARSVFCVCVWRRNFKNHHIINLQSITNDFKKHYV